MVFLLSWPEDDAEYKCCAVLVTSLYPADSPAMTTTANAAQTSTQSVVSISHVCVCWVSPRVHASHDIGSSVCFFGDLEFNGGAIAVTTAYSFDCQAADAPV